MKSTQIEIKKLLSKGSTNAKTVKNSLKTFILYLAPYNQNSKGVNLCPFASKGCAKACLFSAGRGKFNNVQSARKNKTEYLLSNRPMFYRQLASEILNKIKYYSRKGEKIAFRLNGTSDIDHIKALQVYADLDISKLANDAIFYDYTANPHQARKYKNHPNYVVTLSRKEDNESIVIDALKDGINVSAVFSGDLPKTYKGFKVVDGDSSDDLMLNYSGVILGLKAKGDAKKDTTGFVINA